LESVLDARGRGECAEGVAVGSKDDRRLDRPLKLYAVAVADATRSCSTPPSRNFAPIAVPVKGSGLPVPS